MKWFLIIAMAVLYQAVASGQNIFYARIVDGTTNEPLAGATAAVVGLGIGGSAGPDGSVELHDIPDGTHILEFRMVGYERERLTFTFPLATVGPIHVALEPAGEEMEEVVVSTVRGSRTIADEPTRMEVVGAEELDEKSNMKPGDIRMLLSESTGIHIQQTSATTANASIRIQGLDGRYTQMLKDGFPIYGGFAGGLSVMQIPPLDLQRVEVIKGSASTLYGGGAIAGLVNLISRSPSAEPEINVMMNATSAGGMDLSGFYSAEYGDAGLTLFAARNSNSAYDPAGIDLTAIPEFERYTLNPRLFLKISDRSLLTFGVSTTHERRLGGDLHFVRGGGDSTHSYFERNRSARLGAHAGLILQPDDKATLTLKTSVSLFDRVLEVPFHTFDGRQLSTYSEATLLLPDQTSEWVFGANVVTDRFVEMAPSGVLVRDFDHTVVGGFAQHTWTAAPWITLESGFRVDRTDEFGTFILPRVSTLFSFGHNFTSRLGSGLGYAVPTIFTEEAESMHFRDILPIDPITTVAEKSLGVNMDVNVRWIIFEKFSLNVNQLVYYTRINRPLALQATGGGLTYANAEGRIDTRGVETNLKLSYGDVKLLLGYTLTDASENSPGSRKALPLTPRHRLNAVLIHEIEGAWRAGVEAYYFGPQPLSDRSEGRSYWICGLMVEKVWNELSLFINFENLFDTRQTRFGAIYTGSVTHPRFNEIFAPVDGRVINGGVKLRL